MTGNRYKETIEAWAQIIDPGVWDQFFVPHFKPQVLKRRRSAAMEKARAIFAHNDANGLALVAEEAAAEMVYAAGQVQWLNPPVAKSIEAAIAAGRIREKK